jgi:hypothetical protein
LDVCVIRAKQLLGTIDRKLLGDINELTAAVVALAWIALRVLVRKHAALALKDGLGNKVFGCDHLQRLLLSTYLLSQDLGDLRVDLG